MGLINRFNRWVEKLICGGVDRETYARMKTREIANEMYQVTEHGHQLWLTYNGSRVCPISMFETKDAVIVVGMLREMYFADIHGDDFEKEKTKDDDQLGLR